MCFCNDFLESSRNLLFESKFAKHIWNCCYLRFWDIRVFLRECVHHFWQHKGMLNRNKFSLAWLSTWAMVVWGIWLHQNCIKFNSKSFDTKAVFDVVKYMAWSWCKANHHDFNTSLYMWHIQLHE